MKLIYVYIEDYRLLKDLNFNLGGSIRFQFNSLTQRLTSEINTGYLDDFYDVIEERQPNYAFIRNVSAIIGENGTGKTTFFDFIKENFIEGMAGFRSKAILAYEDNINKKIIIYKHKLIPIEGSSLANLRNNGIEVRQYGPKKIIPHNKKLSQHLDISEEDVIKETVGVDYIYIYLIFSIKELKVN
jgi:AAA15 family ATPase/GTPase